MSHDEAVHSKVNVPFSWERKPGVSKVAPQEARPVDACHFRLKLPPPPPCSSNSPRFPFDDNLQIPSSTPAAVLQTPSSSFKKGIGIKQEDPFLRAYKKCAGYPVNDDKLSNTDDKSDRGRSKIKRKNGGSRSSSLSCKYSCYVAGDNLVRMSQLSTPVSKSELKELERDNKRSVGNLL